jgi:hypothetical protein
MFASTLGLKRTLLLGCILDNSLGFVKTLLRAFFEPTACRSTKFSWFLGTSSDWSVFLDCLLGDVADFLGPLSALSVGGVT